MKECLNDVDDLYNLILYVLFLFRNMKVYLNILDELLNIQDEYEE